MSKLPTKTPVYDQIVAELAVLECVRATLSEWETLGNPTGRECNIGSAELALSRSIKRLEDMYSSVQTLERRAPTEPQAAVKAKLFDVTVPLDETFPKGTQFRLNAVQTALDGARQLASDLLAGEAAGAIISILDLATTELRRIDEERDEIAGVDAPTVVEVAHA